MRAAKLDWTSFTGKKLTAIYVVVLTCLTIFAFFAVSGFRDAATTGRWVEHTYEVLIQLESTYSDINACESAGRGFVINGSPDAMKVYRGLEAQVGQDETRFAALTRDNRAQTENLSLLRELVAKRLAQVDEGVSRRAKGTLESSFIQGQSSVGRGLMAEIRQRIDLMEQEEKNLLVLRQSSTYRSSLIGLIFFALSAISGVLLLTGVYSLILRLISSFHDSRLLQEEHNRLLEEEVARTQLARKELERSNRELQDFAFVASHDLQEPLRKIRSYSDRIRVRIGENLDPASSKDLLRMQSAAERMQGLINDILTLSRITTKGQTYETVNLNVVFDEVVDDLETRIQQSHAKVARGNLPTLEADPVQMRQLIQNLVANALKFMKPETEPKVTVDPITSKDKRSVGFVVADNGIGFDERHAEKIFTVFQRLHSRTEYEGSGIGLSICRRIVERHGGSIEAHGKLGEGASFTVVLPKVQPERRSN